MNCLQIHGLIKSHNFFIFKGVDFWAKVSVFLWNAVTTNNDCAWNICFICRKYYDIFLTISATTVFYGSFLLPPPSEVLNVETLFNCLESMLFNTLQMVWI